MSLYEMLKARIVGYSNDFLTNIYAQTFAQPAATWHEYTGTLPYTITSDGTAATINIKGNTVQNGTPTPSNPVEVQGVGTLDNGQYIIPISNNSTTTPIYLGSTQSERKIYKLVFTGEEDWQESNGVYYLMTVSDYLRTNDNITYMCTHYQSQAPISSASLLQNNNFSVNPSSQYPRLYFKDTAQSDRPAFKAFLAQQYTNGTPVTVWYVLATPTTGTVNEPLMKIGTYIDSISGISLPTTSGSNTISASTTVQPSEVYIKWKG